MNVTQFLKTDAARDAAEYSGNSRIADFSADSDGLVARGFSGSYTVPEVRALLADLERLQAACDTARKTSALKLVADLSERQS